MRKTSIAVWGIGHHAEKRIIPAIKESKKLHLVGIFSRDIDKIKRIANEFECIFWETEEKMLKCQNIDVVYISTPTGLHLECVLKTLKHNKNVWCEKPLTDSLKNTQFLINFATKKNLSISECFMYLYHPQYLKIKEFIKKNQNDGFSIFSRFGIPFLDSPGYRYNKDLSGGAYYDVGCYPISLAADILDLNKITVNFSQICFNKKYDVDISGKAILNSKKNMDFILEWAYGKSYRNEIDIWSKESGIYSDKIFSKSDNFSPLIIKLNKDGTKNFLKIKEANHFLLMFNAFIKNLNNIKLRDQEHKKILKRSILIEEIKDRALKLTL